MNNTFNINRFSLLVKRQWLDFGKIYLISLVVLTGVLVGFYLYNMPREGQSFDFDQDKIIRLSFRTPIFLITGFIFISINASSYFVNMSQKSRAILELMTPASTFEKFLCGILYTSILSVASYLIIFYLTDLSFVKYLETLFAKTEYPDHQKAKDISLTIQSFSKELGKQEIKYFFALPFLIISIFLLGSIYFNRFHYIKTAVSLTIFITVLVYLMSKILPLITKNMVEISSSGGSHGRDDVFVFILISSVVLTAIFWLITYLRLKEKEV